jgi:hypothetical protein
LVALRIAAATSPAVCAASAKFDTVDTSARITDCEPCSATAKLLAATAQPRTTACVVCSASAKFVAPAATLLAMFPYEMV